MASTDAKPLPLKNVAFRLTVDLRLNTGALNTSAAGLDSEVSKDGGAFTDCTNEWTEIGTSGTGTLDLTNTEMNADTVLVQIKSSTSGAVTRTITIYPNETGDIVVNAAQVGGQTASAAGTVTFPGTIASTTNITAGTLTTVTNLTNLPAITNNWLTAAGINADAFTAAKFASDVGTEFATAVWANGTRTLTSLSGLTVDTVTTLTNLPAITANWLTAAGTAADFGVEIATAVWANGTRSLTTLSGLTVDTVTTLTNLPAITANWLTAAGTAADFGTEVGTAVWASAARTLTSVSGLTINSNITQWGGQNVSGSFVTDGQIEVIVDSVNDDAITALSIDDGAFTSTKFGTNFINNGSFASGAIHATAMADGAIRQGVITDVTNADLGNASTGFLTMITLDGAVYQFTANALELGPGGGSAPTVQQITDGVLNELLSAHTIVGSVGAGIANASSAGDPMATILPGAYTGTQAGALIYSTYGKAQLITNGDIEVIGLIFNAGVMELYRGDDYTTGSPNGPVPFTSTSFPDLTTMDDITLRIAGIPDIEGTAVSATQCTFEIPRATTEAMTNAGYEFEIYLTEGGFVGTRVKGKFKMIGEITETPA